MLLKVTSTLKYENYEFDFSAGHEKEPEYFN